MRLNNNILWSPKNIKNKLFFLVIIESLLVEMKATGSLVVISMMY